MSERQVEKAAVDKALPAFDAMGCRIVRPARKPIDPDKYIYVETIGVRPLKSDPTRTEAYVEKKEKIDEMVREAAKTVGLDVAISQIARGLARPEDFIDDGKGFVDDTVIPETRGDLIKAAKENKAFIEKNAGALGLDPSKLTLENIEQMITEAVNNKLEAAKAAQGGKE